MNNSIAEFSSTRLASLPSAQQLGSRGTSVASPVLHLRLNSGDFDAGSEKTAFYPAGEIRFLPPPKDTPLTGNQKIKRGATSINT